MMRHARLPAVGETEAPGGSVTQTNLATGSLLAIAIGYVLLEATLNGWRGYGFFSDELYYIACSKRLAFGYVDHPPLAPFLLRGVRAVLGDSLPAIRIPAAVAGAATVFLAGRMAWRLGGNAFAQTLAALAVAAAPGLMILFGFYSTNAFEILIWVVCADLVMVLTAGGDPRLWLAVGVVLGLGLEDKHTTAVFGAALAVSLVATPARRLLRGPWPWLGLLVALLVFVPNLIWEVRHQWISLEFYRTAVAVKNVPTSSLGAAFGQMLFMNPVIAPLWLLGLWFYLVDHAGRPWRVLGAVFVTLFALILIAPSSRPDRIAGAYPMLLAAGAVVLERPALRLLRNAFVPVLAASTAVLAPLALPLLSPVGLASYAATLHINPQIEIQRRSPVPQWVADRLGWEDLAAAVAAVLRGLPDGERQNATVLAGDYGYAAALERFGPAMGITRVIGNHNNYFLWGPGDTSPSVVVAFGISRRDLDRLFAKVERAAEFRCDFCYQDRMPIWVAREPRISLAEAWPSLKHFE
jgi:4-amino-4-deoxy-L-arabinose transferase-like glycosyltransferase